MKRRAFFKGIAAAAAAAPLLPDTAAGLAERLGTLSQDVATASNERTLWQRVRREFLLNPRPSASQLRQYWARRPAW